VGVEPPHPKGTKMDHDDLPVGRVLSRREVMAITGTASLAALLGLPRVAGAQDPAKPKPRDVSRVVVSPELTEGPFFVEEYLNRSDIRSDPKTGVLSPGMLLHLTINLVTVGAVAKLLPGATVDIWHCDATGRYSDEEQNGTAGLKFLRGSQVSDKDGKVEFTTIYPGWYPGRAVHIHFKIRHPRDGQTREFTSQLFFDETTTNEIHAKAPYAARGTRDTMNNRDGIYRQGGNKLMLALEKTKSGYAGVFDVGLTQE